MTTNEDHAQRIVGGVIDRLTTDRSGVPVATRITRALADAGLLMGDALIAEKRAHQKLRVEVGELRDAYRTRPYPWGEVARELDRILEADNG